MSDDLKDATLKIENLEREIRRLRSAAFNFLRAYDTLQQTCDSYGLFKARNELHTELKSRPFVLFTLENNPTRELA